MPPIMEEIVEVVQEVVKLVPRERVQQRIDEQNLFHTFSDDIFEECKSVPQEQFSEKICEQIVDVPVPQVDVLEALQFQARAISLEIQDASTWIPEKKSCRQRNTS